EAAVHQQRPYVAEGDVTDQVLDVDAAVTQRAAVLVRLGDLGAEGHVALQPRLEPGWRRRYLRARGLGGRRAPARGGGNAGSCGHGSSSSVPNTAVGNRCAQQPCRSAREPWRTSHG